MARATMVPHVDEEHATATSSTTRPPSIPLIGQPWRPYQDYPLDRAMLRYANVDGSVMTFTR
ncbi:MAG: hypothetical protein H0T42_19920 [Deltaproteobacteria bacterium]|nr:hypothetical protein [Deltaproteobacteria bacterium]